VTALSKLVKTILRHSTPPYASQSCQATKCRIGREGRRRVSVVGSWAQMLGRIRPRERRSVCLGHPAENNYYDNCG
jgi:hypothetical protein